VNIQILDRARLSFVMTFVSLLMFLRQALCCNVTGSLKQVQNVFRVDEQVGVQKGTVERLCMA